MTSPLHPPVFDPDSTSAKGSRCGRLFISELKEPFKASHCVMCVQTDAHTME